MTWRFPMKRRFAEAAAWAAVFCALITGCASTQHSLLSEGIAHYGAGRDNEAVAVLTEAAGKPGNELPWVYKMRAGAYMRLGRYDLALADIERFLPGAADSRAAQDQIYKWEGLAK
jgi:Flp pilus assembly protein TadD